MECPNCTKGKLHKNGRIKDAQRFRCKLCGYSYTKKPPAKMKTEELALRLLVCGSSRREVSDLLRVSESIVYGWQQKGFEIYKNMVSRSRKELITVELEDLKDFVNIKETSRYGIFFSEGIVLRVKL